MEPLDLTRLTEEQAREYLERLRWSKGVCCAHCGKANVSHINGGRDGLYQCCDCRQQFTVTVGTIFEGSHIPLSKWVYAIHLLCASKKGISALQLSRMLGLTYKTAWFMAHRVREAMQPYFPMLQGIVEVDETYVGGKVRDRTGRHGTGRGTKNKTAVVAVVARNGGAITRVLKTLNTDNLHDTIERNVVPSATIFTDELAAYRGIGASFRGGHKTVKHSSGSYVRRGGIHTNNAESFFALFKRGLHGSFHHVSKKHLQRYADEFGFRWSYRKTTDAERQDVLLKKLAGRGRLRYRSLVNGGEAKA